MVKGAGSAIALSSRARPGIGEQEKESRREAVRADPGHWYGYAMLADAVSRMSLVRYAQAATGLVGTAGRTHAAAVRELPGYLALYHQLETDLSRLDDAMMAAVNASSVRVSRTLHTSNWIILLAGAIGALITIAAGLRTLQAIRGPLRDMQTGLRAAAGATDNGPSRPRSCGSRTAARSLRLKKGRTSE